MGDETPRDTGPSPADKTDEVEEVATGLTQERIRAILRENADDARELDDRLRRVFALSEANLSLRVD